MRHFCDDLLGELYQEMTKHHTTGTAITEYERALLNVLSITSIQSKLNIKLPPTYVRGKFIIFQEKFKSHPTIIFELRTAEGNYHHAYLMLFPTYGLGTTLTYIAIQLDSDDWFDLLKQIDYKETE